MTLKEMRDMTIQETRRLKALILSASVINMSTFTLWKFVLGSPLQSLNSMFNLEL
jgi:hypothetical protein